MRQIIPFGQYNLKEIAKLPPHITYEEFNALLGAVQLLRDKKCQQEALLLESPDKLLLSLLWETGGRIADICSLGIKDFDFRKRELSLFMRKREQSNVITLSDRMLFEISEYLRNYHIQTYLFDFTRQRAWQLVKRYAGLAGVKDVPPHKFRHGLAIYLLQQGVPIPVISPR